jgi:hypothetical protein
MFRVRRPRSEQLQSPVGIEALAARLAIAIAVAAEAAATTAAAATAATEAAATTAAAATEAAATTAAAATEAAATTAAAAAATEASTRTRSAGLGLIHDKRATLELLAIQVLDGGLSGLLRAHGHEAESTRTSRLTVSPDEHIQHFAVLGEDLTKAFWRRTIIEISDKDLEHVWPPGQFAPA